MKKTIIFCILILFSLISVEGKPIYNYNSDKYRVSLSEDSSLSEKLVGETVTATIELNYPDKESSKIPFSSDLKYNQKKLMQLRKENKEYYYNQNIKFMELMGLDKSEYIVSSYSPYIFKYFSDVKEYRENEERLIDISDQTYVNSIYIDPKYRNENSLEKISEDITTNISESTTSMTLSQAKTMIGVNDSSYTGDGIKVGILEIEGINDMRNFDDNIVNYNPKSTRTVDENIVPSHATNVATIIGGTQGVAPECSMYVFQWDGNNISDFNYSLEGGIEWLIEQGVNVINMSGNDGDSSAVTGDFGKYNGLCAYIDHIVSKEYVSFIKSAGNSETPSKMVSTPGTALNVITVGSIDYNQNLAYRSRYELETGYEILMKPTLVAPSEKMSIPNAGIKSGTSYAAPLVSGTIALLLEQFPNLMFYPEILISTLVNGANLIKGQTVLWHEKVGAGLINYDNTVNIISNSQYFYYNVSKAFASGAVLESHDVILGAGKTIDLSFFHLVSLDYTVPGKRSINIPEFTKYLVPITDTNDDIEYTMIVNSNIGVCSYQNNSSSSKTIRLRVVMNGQNLDFSSQYLCLSYNIY